MSIYSDFNLRNVLDSSFRCSKNGTLQTASHASLPEQLQRGTAQKERAAKGNTSPKPKLMESLRRLTSSVFEAAPGSRLRRASLSDAAAEARALDLTRITPRLLVAGFPADAPTDRKLNRVNAAELAAFLDARHAQQFLLFSLNALDDVGAAGESASKPPSPVAAAVARHLWRSEVHGHEQQQQQQQAESVAGRLHEQVLELGWERDGMKAHTPPLDLVFRICYAIFAWLSLDPANVAIVSCQTGKTRSGVVVACYLLFARLADDPLEAFVEFYRKRWDMKALTPQALRNKTPPSIQRFLTSFHELVEQQKPPNDKPLLLKAIMFRQLPVEVQPCVQIWDDYRMIFCTDNVQGSGGNDTPVLEWNEDDGFFAILWETGIELDGGFSILCSFGEDYENADDVDASSRVLFRYADSTWFMTPGMVTLKKSQLDLMKQYEHGFDDELFSMDLVVHDNSAKQRRASVRIDYTGNNAVRQGLIEITKHHMVLPDPAMHSNFIRMGFCETPTTFALQRSQNTPNIALDILHMESISACFKQEQPESLMEAKELSRTASTPLPQVDVSTNNRPPLIRRQTTAEIVAMQSQRSRYSIPISKNSSQCDVCKEDDYMMRPQVVQCTGRCEKFYHTTCVGLRKIPFGLTTMSDRTNHAVYMKKFFSSWECDACAEASALAAANSTQIPENMTLVPSDWVSVGLVRPPSATDSPAMTDLVGNPQDVSTLHPISNSSRVQTVHISEAITSEGIRKATPTQPDHENLDQLKAFLTSSGISVDELLRAATNRDVALPSPLDSSSPMKSFSPPPQPISSSETLSVSNSEAVQPRLDVEAVQEANSQHDDKYERMLKRGVPFEAVQNCMVRDGQDPATLKPVEHKLQDSSDVPACPAATVIRLKDMEEYRSYFSMIRMGCPREAVKQKLLMDGVDPVILELGPDAVYEDVQHKISASRIGSKLQDDIKCVKTAKNSSASEENIQKTNASASAQIKLKDHEVYGQYFKMLKMGLPEGAVRHKMKKDGVDDRALDHSGEAPVSILVISSSSDNSSGDLEVKLKDHETYAKYFKMLKMGLPEAAVRHKMKKDGADEKALELGGDAAFSVLILQSSENQSGDNAVVTEVKLKDHEVYSKYFKMLEMGLPEGAVRHKVVMDGADIRALVLGPEAPASALTSATSAGATPNQTSKNKTKTLRGRKKLHWQPIAEDRLSSLNQHTIWEDKEEDIVELEMDMDELESLFFVNQDAATKKAASRGGGTLKRKQSVTLIDGKRAMNAAISLARVKLSYSAIATAVETFDRSGLTVEQLMGINEFLPTPDEVATVNGYNGDVSLLGEAEKFIREIAKVKRYGSRTECLIFKLSFESRASELTASLENVRGACEEVKSSRLLKLLLGTVLKLGNTLNGSGDDNGIRGFTVDSLLRLGHTKAVNHKTTVLHYLVRLIKKNLPQVLDFQQELKRVPLAARESFDGLNDDFGKLRAGLTKVKGEIAVLEKV